MQDAHVMIRGFVQGVGFRKWARKTAEKELLTGWVRNLPDGSVEVLLQGEKEAIDKVLAEYKKGPFLSEVREVDVILEDRKEEFSDFSVRHDF